MRERILFCDGWKFHKGDIKINVPMDKGPLYMQAKTERFRMGPAAKNYSDIPDSYDTIRAIPSEKWEYVRLPHDYVVYGTPDKNENCARGYLKYDNAWYRKQFFLPKDDVGKRIIIEFEGISGKSTVYLNGCVMKRSFSGYTSFEIDITDYAILGDENTIAVYVDNTEHEGWWYEGGGIYRNVWLLKTDEIAVDTYGVYVVPKRSYGDNWKIDIETTVINKSDRAECVELVSELVDANDLVVAFTKAKLSIEAYSSSVAKYSTDVTSPRLWDIDSPYLYIVKTTLYRNGSPCDEYVTRTGFRYFECDAEKGFFLNGRHVKIKGVCAHEDCGLLGKAVPANVHRYKMEMLKEMGANGYRTVHYQQSSAILDALDELGFIVLNEARWFASTEDGIQQLEALVKRDRNRPSVFFWSLSNEEYYHLNEQGRKITKSLKAVLRKLDNTRPITSAVDKSPEKATVFDELDIVGINYNLGLYDEVHTKYPQKAIFSSENCATGTTRSWYSPDCKERGYISSYDKDANAWFRGREYTWNFIDDRDWIMGGYQWAGFEHRGETVWPRLCSQSGAIDLFLQKKDAFYQNQSHWSDKPMVHILPHWNVDVFDGEPVKVWVYTNCEEVELFLNGRSLGHKVANKNEHLEYNVDYEKGCIEAIGYIDGKSCANERHESAGEPRKLMLRLENKVEGVNDIAIISCYTVDAYGNFVPNASPEVSFHTNSFGRIIATGSDVADHTPLDSPIRKMREGYISIAAGVSIERGVPVGDCGIIEVYATSYGLESARIKIKVGK